MSECLHIAHVSEAATALDRAAIRAQAVARFGRERMVDVYIDAYEAVTRERR